MTETHKNERPILFSTDMVKAILEGNKTQTRRVITNNNSLIGEGGYWANLDFEGKSIHYDSPIEYDFDWLQIARKAPLPFIDGNSKKYHNYLHVPYRWAEDMTIYRVYPRYQVGDRLWVRERFCLAYISPPSAANCHMGDATPLEPYQDKIPKTKEDDLSIDYYADDKEPDGQCYWNSIHMPRWASRITLKITEIRVQRVQEIDSWDCIAEGINRNFYNSEFQTVTNKSNAMLIDNFHSLWDSINGKRYPWESNPWVWAISFKVI